MTPFDRDLNELRRVLQSASDFSVPALAFHDGVAISKPFRKACRPSKNKDVARLVQLAGAQVVGPEALGAEVMLMRCRGTDFYHGGLMLSTSVVAFFYFNDVHQGLAMVQSFDSPATDYIRLTTMMTLPPDFIPTPDTGGAPN